MGNNKLVPKSIDYVVIPVGDLNLIRSEEEIKTAMDTFNNCGPNQTGDKMAEDKELKNDLPKTKYGRDENNKALTKDGKPRKDRSDIGHKRGKRNKLGQ